MVHVVYSEPYVSIWDESHEVPFRDDQANRHRACVVEHGIRRLCAGNLPGREHTERYLRHKYRFNCSADPIRANISVLYSFLVFLKDIGKVLRNYTNGL